MTTLTSVEHKGGDSTATFQAFKADTKTQGKGLRMRRLTPTVTTQGMKVTDKVQAHCPDCGEQAEVYDTGLVRCTSKPCIRDGRCKLFAPTARREPELHAMLTAHHGNGHGGKKKRRTKPWERSPQLKRGGRCASTGVRA